MHGGHHHVRRVQRVDEIWRESISLFHHVWFSVNASNWVESSVKLLCLPHATHILSTV